MPDDNPLSKLVEPLTPEELDQIVKGVKPQYIPKKRESWVQQQAQPQVQARTLEEIFGAK